MAQLDSHTGFGTGMYVSGIGHGLLLLWILIGGFFVARDDFSDLAVSDVSIVSAEEFAALQPAAPSTPDAPDAPPAPVVPDAAPAAPSEDTARPTPTPPEPVTPAVPDEAPAPVLSPAPAEITDTAPVTPDEPSLIDGDNGGLTIEPDATPTPQQAPRVAQEAAPAPDPDVQIVDTVQAPTAPDPDATPIDEAQEATAPEETTTQIVTEADEPAGGITRSTRPGQRPAPPPQPVVAEAEEPTQDPTPAPQEDANPLGDAINSAVAEAAQQDNAAPTLSGASGPPLTSGERDGFRLGIQRCWNVGALGTDALQVVVVVAFDMEPDGKPNIGSINLLSSTGGSGAAVNRAYEAARRAIIRCGAQGYDLPSDKYDQWREVEVTFNAARGQIR
ncbi:energy transducer TonB [Litoreibacter roseus]|uniref:Cell envelope integrity/translocation protein TolA n=1 Tax=Litoreibacter roseus TaxID=2601869 RepID=A0A6N6JGZ2_9RHOB|nr:energy transducer TonB [Litoreibacter roseus]GFE65385.1 cell envelope integrity/translocation protein TolA [Litoreibacter roseus]